MSKQRKQIEAAAEKLGLKIGSMSWTPLGPAALFEGPSGGWEVETTDGRHFLGYNVAEVIADMDSSVRFGWNQRQFDLGRRVGVLNAAKEKDAEIARLRELVAALSEWRGPFPGSYPDGATRAVNQVKRDVLCEFVRAIWRHVPYAQSKSGCHEPVPVYNWAIQDIMRATFGDDWNNDAAFEPSAEPITIRQSDGPFNTPPPYLRCVNCDRLTEGEVVIQP